MINMFGYPHEMARSMSIALERMSRIKDAQRFNEHTECIICLADFTDTDMVTPLPCDKRHFFHTKCIKEWARQKQHCPLCNVRFTRDQLD